MAQLRVTTKALPEHNRQHNRSLLLQTLFHDGPMSRADLARVSGLTRVTVSDLVAELTADGLIVDLGQRPGVRIGKPAMLIALDEHAHHVVSLDLSAADAFTGAIVSLGGDIIERLTVPLAGGTGAAAVEKAIALAAALVAKSAVHVLGIGIGTPGIVDHAGVVREAPNLGWADIDLGAAFGAAFAVPVHIANDANAAVLAIHTFGKTVGRSVMLVAIGHGVGAGLIVGGVLVEGDQFAAGEIGHVIVEEDGERCECGRYGCLETAVAVPHIRSRLAAGGAAGRDAVLAEAGTALGVGLAPVIAALGLDEVVIAGPTELLAGPFLAAARETIERRTLAAVTNGLELRLAEDSDELVLLGATVPVLSRELGIS